jgi:hypothetical protein
MPRGYLAKLVALIVVVVGVGVVRVPHAKAEGEARVSESTKMLVTVIVIVIAINTAQADITVGWRGAAEDAPGLISHSGTYFSAKCPSGWRVAAENALISYRNVLGRRMPLRLL